MTLVELLTGKKPFKKKFQKYKHTDDKVQVCKTGQAEDAIEEKNIEAKLGKAKEEEEDGRDSNDEETDDDDDDDEAKKKTRRSSIRIIGGFDKTVESAVETDVAIEFLDGAIQANDKLTSFSRPELDGGVGRLVKVRAR